MQSPFSSTSTTRECSLCSHAIPLELVCTFPLTFQAPDLFPTKSNQTFCSPPCVKRYLISCDTYLQTLYSLYCILQYGSPITPAPDPLLFACRQIETNEQSLFQTEEKKQCTLCFRYTENPKTYVTHKENGQFKLANVVFCCRPCVKEYLRLNMEPYFMDLFQEYAGVVYNEPSIGFAHDPRRLKTRQIHPEVDSLTIEEYHSNYHVPCSGLPKDQYYTRSIQS